MDNYNNNKYSWECIYPLKYYDMDCNHILKPSALMNFLQDTATVNAEMLGFGYSFTHPRDYAWFLIKYHMEFNAYPENTDRILIKTEARGISKILATRDFEIWTPDNKECLGRITSSWALINLKNKKILPIKKAIDFMFDYEKRPDDLKFSKITSPNRIDFEKKFEIRYEDIDINQHVNNANYIVWAFEPLPWDFRINKKLQELDIIYHKEIKYGNSIISHVQIDGNTSTHVLKNSANNDELCLIKAIWN